MNVSLYISSEHVGLDESAMYINNKKVMLKIIFLVPNVDIDTTIPNVDTTKNENAVSVLKLYR
jgi:hypothetical protein